MKPTSVNMKKIYQPFFERALTEGVFRIRNEDKLEKELAKLGFNFEDQSEIKPSKVVIEMEIGRSDGARIEQSHDGKQFGYREFEAGIGANSTKPVTLEQIKQAILASGARYIESTKKLSEANQWVVTLSQHNEPELIRLGKQATRPKIEYNSHMKKIYAIRDLNPGPSTSNDTTDISPKGLMALARKTISGGLPDEKSVAEFFSHIKPLAEKITILNREQSQKFFEIMVNVASKVQDMNDDEYQEFLDKVEMYVYNAEDNNHKLSTKMQDLFNVHKTYRIKPEQTAALLKEIKYPQRVVDAVIQALDDVGAYVLSSTQLTEQFTEVEDTPKS